MTNSNKSGANQPGNGDSKRTTAKPVAPSISGPQGGSHSKSGESGGCCDPKPASSGAKDSSQVRAQGASPVNPKGSVGNLSTPTQSLGTRQVKGDDNRASQQANAGSGSSRDSGKSSSASKSAASGSSPVKAQADSSRRDLTSPQDPAQRGRTDPVQPKRSAPTQPSHVQRPTIGSAGDDA